MSFFKLIMVKGKQRFTVMLIPHSEKKIFNFQISLFTLIFVTFTLSIVLVGFFVLATHFTYTNEQNVQLTQSVTDYEKAIATLKDQIAEIKSAGKQLQASVNDIVQNAMEGQDSSGIATVKPVAASFSTVPEDSVTGTKDYLASLPNTTAVLKTSAASLKQISDSLRLYQDLFASTPTTWPLKGGVGNITTKFGWTTNVFTHIGYVHTGVDIAWTYGTPVLATADGKVVQTGLTDDLGNFILIQHKYGFYTRYAHLSAYAGKYKGALVKRGDIIGYLGSTGLSTGNHLHYEVRLGAQYTNPLPFLSINPGHTAVALSGGGSD